MCTSLRHAQTGRLKVANAESMSLSTACWPVSVKCLDPRQATQSALITVCIGNGELRAARRVYEETLRQGIAPHLHAYNCLINAYAAHFRLGDVVRACCM